jgi:hypothetical protein
MFVLRPQWVWQKGDIFILDNYQLFIIFKISVYGNMADLGDNFVIKIDLKTADPPRKNDGYC